MPFTPIYVSTGPQGCQLSLGNEVFFTISLKPLELPRLRPKCLLLPISQPRAKFDMNKIIHKQKKIISIIYPSEYQLNSYNDDHIKMTDSFRLVATIRGIAEAYNPEWLHISFTSHGESFLGYYNPKQRKGIFYIIK